MNGKFFCDENPMLRDYGPEPLIINIDRINGRTVYENS